MRKGILKFTKYEIQTAVKNSESFMGVLKYLGKNPKSGGQNILIKTYIKQLNIDTSHFTGMGWNKNNKSNNLIINKKSLDDILSNKVTIKSNPLKHKLLQENIKKYECEKCKLSKWNDIPISLELHHIDGDIFNNQLHNLQILCPNCHAQTDNFRKGGKRKYKHSCSNCSNKLYTRNQTGLCRECFVKITYKS